MKRTQMPLRSALSLITAVSMMLFGCTGPGPSQRAPIQAQASLMTPSGALGQVQNHSTTGASYKMLSASGPTRARILFSRKAGAGYANIRDVMSKLITGKRYIIADVGGAAPSPFICGGQAVDVPSPNVNVQYEPPPPPDVMSVFSSPAAALSEGQALGQGFQTTVASWSDTYVVIDWTNPGFQTPSWQLAFTLFPNGDVLEVVDQLPYGMGEGMGCYVSGATPTPGVSPTPSASPTLSLDKTLSAFSPVAGPNAPNKDSLHPTDTILITSSNPSTQWVLSVDGHGQIKTGTGNLNWDWDGKVNGIILKDGTYTLRLTAQGAAPGPNDPTATVVIDTKAPEISNFLMAQDSSDSSGNSYRLTGTITDGGPASLDLTTVKAEIVGAAVSNQTNPMLPGKSVIDTNLLIQAQNGSHVEVKVSASDTAGNQGVWTYVPLMVQADPAFSPNGDQNQDLCNVWVQADPSLDQWNLTVDGFTELTGDGPGIVASLKGDAQISWFGSVAAKILPPGTYTLRVKAGDQVAFTHTTITSGKSLPRGGGGGEFDQPNERWLGDIPGRDSLRMKQSPEQFPEGILLEIKDIIAKVPTKGPAVDLVDPIARTPDQMDLLGRAWTGSGRQPITENIKGAVNGRVVGYKAEYGNIKLVYRFPKYVEKTGYQQGNLQYYELRTTNKPGKTKFIERLNYHFDVVGPLPVHYPYPQ